MPGRTNAPFFLASLTAKVWISSKMPATCFLVRLVLSARWLTLAALVMTFAIDPPPFRGLG